MSFLPEPMVRMVENELGGRPHRRRFAVGIRGIVFLGLAGFTAWVVTRSDALLDADEAFRRADFAAAAGRALDHLDRRPWSRDAARLAALSLSKLDFAAPAESYYRRAGRRLGLDDLHVRAYGLVRANRRLDAEAAYREILARRPLDPLALRRLGAELMSQSRWDDALSCAERLATVAGSEAEALAMIAAIEHQRGNPEAVAAAGDRLLKLDPELRRLSADPAFRRVFWTQYAQALLAVGRATEARRSLEGALDRLGEDASLLRLLGRAYEQEGSFEAAQLAWQRAVEIDPNLGAAWLDLGQFALARNRPAEAIAPLERAARLAPAADAPAYSLAIAHHRLGHAAEAARWSDRAEANRKRYKAPPRRAGP